MTRAQKKTANPERYAVKAYLTYDESTDFLGISLSTLARYISDEKIQTLKFYRDKKRYLKIEDVRRIEDLIKSPWKRTVPPESQIAGAIPMVAEERVSYLSEQKEGGTPAKDKSEPTAA